MNHPAAPMPTLTDKLIAATRPLDMSDVEDIEETQEEEEAQD